MVEESIPIKRKVGRPRGSLCGKYKDVNGNLIGVMEWRRTHPSWHKEIKELKRELGIESQEWRRASPDWHKQTKELKRELGIESQNNNPIELLITTDIIYDKNFNYLINKDEKGFLIISKQLK